MEASKFGVTTMLQYCERSACLPMSKESSSIFLLKFQWDSLCTFQATYFWLLLNSLDNSTYFTLGLLCKTSFWYSSSPSFKLTVFSLTASGKQVWTAGVRGCCAWDNHIRDIHSQWHHMKPRQEKRCWETHVWSSLKPWNVLLTLYH